MNALVPFISENSQKILLLKLCTTLKRAINKAMGNCLVLEASMVVKIVKSDGKTLKYKTPIKVHQILKQFSNHAVSDSQLMHLHPNTKLLNDELYYLVPLPLPSPKANKKKVRFAEPEIEGGGASESGLIRIKLVISKQELQHMVHNGGISVNEMLSLVHDEKGVDGTQDVCRRIDYCSQGWKPALESIPEVN